MPQPRLQSTVEERARKTPSQGEKKKKKKKQVIKEVWGLFQVKRVKQQSN